jgi:hypothetical protein
MYGTKKIVQMYVQLMYGINVLMYIHTINNYQYIPFLIN